MAHTHQPGGADVVVAPATRRALVVVSAVMGVLTVVGLVVLWPEGGDRPGLRHLGVASEVFEGRVVGVDQGPCTGTQPRDAVVCTFADVELLEGPDAGTVTQLEIAVAPGSPDLDRGEHIVLTRAEDERGAVYQFADRERRGVLLALAALFGIAVVVLGRLRGLAALGGLAASLGVLFWFTLPAIVDGRQPLLVAVVTSSAIAYVALYLAHGLRPMTTVALLGTLASLALTVLLAALFVWLAHFSGFATEESVYLQVAGGRIDLQGLLLAGIVIGALGALDDMTVTQASAVWELKAAAPAMSTISLLGAGLRIGRDHVASTVNTLVLAYAGASMPLLLLFVLSEQSLGTVANSELVATEIVRTLVGSIGLVASVPLTTWLAARVVQGSEPVADEPVPDDPPAAPRP